MDSWILFCFTDIICYYYYSVALLVETTFSYWVSFILVPVSFQHVLLSEYSLLGIKRCSKLILYFTCSSPGSFYWATEFRNQDLGTSYAHCFLVSLLLGLLNRQSWETYVCSSLYIHTYVRRWVVYIKNCKSRDT